MITNNIRIVLITVEVITVIVVTSDSSKTNTQCMIRRLGACNGSLEVFAFQTDWLECQGRHGWF